MVPGPGPQDSAAPSRTDEETLETPVNHQRRQIEHGQDARPIRLPALDHVEDALGSFGRGAAQDVHGRAADVFRIGLRRAAVDEPAQPIRVRRARPLLERHGRWHRDRRVDHAAVAVHQDQAVEAAGIAQRRLNRRDRPPREAGEDAAVEVQRVHDAEHVIDERIRGDPFNGHDRLAGGRRSTPTSGGTFTPGRACVAVGRRRV
jgi:hypothetical protein